MRKFFAILLCCMIVCSLASCENLPQKNDDTTTTGSPDTVPFDPDAPLLLRFADASDLKSFVQAVKTSEAAYDAYMRADEPDSAEFVNFFSYEHMQLFVDRLSDFWLPICLVENTSSFSIGYYDYTSFQTLQIIGIVDNVIYRFNYYFEKEIAPIEDQTPVCRNMEFGPYRIDFYRITDDQNKTVYRSNFTMGDAEVCIIIRDRNYATLDTDDISFEHFRIDRIENVEPDDDIIIDYAPVKVLKSLEEYQQYLETAELPEGFVTYEQLSWIGDYFGAMTYRIEDNASHPFHSYSIVSTMQEKPLSYQIGCFYDGEFPLYVQHYAEHSLEEMPKDLRTIPMDGVEVSSPLSGVRLIYNDKLQYVYDDEGTIMFIILEVDGVCITLESYEYLYWLYGDPIFDLFLDRDTAAEAYENFAAHISGTVAEE